MRSRAADTVMTACWRVAGMTVLSSSRDPGDGLRSGCGKHVPGAVSAGPEVLAAGVS
jgi:hypothetical protein